MVESCLTTSVIQSCNRSIPRIPFSSGRFITAVILFSINLLRYSSGCRRVLCLSPDKLHKICFLHDNLQFVLDSCDDIINE